MGAQGGTHSYFVLFFKVLIATIHLRLKERTRNVNMYEDVSIIANLNPKCTTRYRAERVATLPNHLCLANAPAFFLSDGF